MTAPLTLPAVPPPASDADRAAWVEAGRANGGAAEVLYHAGDAAHSGRGLEACPFGNEAPAARDRWVWYYRLASRAQDERDLAEVDLWRRLDAGERRGSGK